METSSLLSPQSISSGGWEQPWGGDAACGRRRRPASVSTGVQPSLQRRQRLWSPWRDIRLPVICYTSKAASSEHPGGLASAPGRPKPFHGTEHSGTPFSLAGVFLWESLVGPRHLHLRQETSPPAVGSKQHAGAAHQRPPLEVRNHSAPILIPDDAITSSNAHPKGFLALSYIEWIKSNDTEDPAKFPWRRNHCCFFAQWWERKTHSVLLICLTSNDRKVSLVWWCQKFSTHAVVFLYCLYLFIYSTVIKGSAPLFPF